MKIADLRQEYMRESLDENNVARDPFVQFDRWFNEAIKADADAERDDARYRLGSRHAAIEFWQGRANRPHDRVLYSRSDAGWKIERLAP